MHKQMPYGGDRKTMEADRVNRVLGRKDGGRVKDDGETNIHIEINADPRAAQSAEDAMPPPTAGPPPPAPPMMPPPGVGGGPPPGGGGMGPIAGLKSGGAVKKQVGGPRTARMPPRPVAAPSGRPGVKPMATPRPGVKPMATPAVNPRAAAAPAVNPRAAAAVAGDPRAAFSRRAKGGGVGEASSYADMDAGAGSGPGREEKTDIARKQRRG